MNVDFVRKLIGGSLRPGFGVVLRLLNTLRADAIADEFYFGDPIEVLDQRGMAKRRRTGGWYVWLISTALDYSSLRGGPTIEGRAISQLLETRPEQDNAQQQSECGGKDCFH